MAAKKTTKTSAGLCDALFDEFDMLRNGESDSSRAAAVAKLAVQIINTKKLELEAAQLIKGGLQVRSVIFDNNGLKLGGGSKK
jgi:hypothetical protein